MPPEIPQKLTPSIAETILGPSPSRDWTKAPVLTLVSLFLHLFVLGAIGLIAFSNPHFVDETFTTVMDNEKPLEPISEQSLIQTSENIKDVPRDEFLSLATLTDLPFDRTGPIALNFSEGPPQVQSISSDLPGVAEIKVGHEMSGRMSIKTKKSMVEKYGGSSASEAAVVAGLKWLSHHQQSNGSWSFEHSKHPECKGQCSQNGVLKNCPNGATSMALLAFLGAGHTHFGGDYQTQVKRALEFLQKSGKQTPKGLDLRGAMSGIEGMYVQGLSAIALCECSAMTNDTRLRKSAKGAIEFIVNAQNQTTGGWRYQPGDPGDTSVVGWQVMALKSAHNAKIEFASKAFKGAELFLDAAQTDRGSQYVYVPGRGRRSSEPDDTMTAVGLLCRMYLGWDRSNPKLAAGVDHLDEVKPQRNNMYFNYYATQVMHHWGGEEWTRWNDVMRDQLVQTQYPPRNGHLAGSWDVADLHGDSGGRLYMTCLCVMTLEVYYRHLPLYNRDHLKVEF